MKLWQTADVVRQPVGDELLLLEQGNGRLHHLNATAAWIYANCDGRTSESLADALTTRFEVEPDAALGDVLRVTGQLVELGLVQHGDPQT